MNKDFIAKNVIILLLLTGILLMSSAFAYADDKENIFGTIDFVIDSNDIAYTDYYIGNDVIAVDSTGYTFEKDFQFIDEPVCLQWNKERINGTWVDTTCENWDTQQRLDKVVLAKLNFKTCSEGSWYRIYRSENYYTTKEDIIANGQYFQDVQCIDGKVSFEVEDFSSYTQEQIDNLKASLLTFWSFDNVSGSTIYDEGSLKNNATRVGAVSSFTAGKIGNAYTNDGTSNNYVSVPEKYYSPFNSADAYTIAFWSKTTDDNSQVYMYDFYGEMGNRVACQYHTTNEVWWGTSAGLSNTTADINKCGQNTWEFHTFVYYNSTKIIYRNGTIASSGTDTGITVQDAASVNSFGSSRAAGFTLAINGQIDEVYIWDRALSAIEVERLYNITDAGDTLFNVTTISEVPNNVSYLAIPLETADFSFASTTDILFSNYTFNLTKNGTDMVLVDSFDFIKTSGGGTSDVAIRVDLDGATQYDAVVRTLTRDQYAVSGTPPIFFDNLSEGSHTIESYIRRTGNGNIDVTNIGEVLLEYETTSGAEGRGNVSNVTATVSSTTMTSVWNETINKFQNTSTYIAGTLKFTSALDSLAVCQFRDGNVSPYMIIDIPAGTTKSVAMNYITDPPQQTELLELYCNATSGTTVTVTGSIVEVDKTDNDGDIINFVFASNSSTNYTNTVSLGAGHTDYLTKDITLQNGTGVFISGSISFASGSGAHTPLFHVNVTNSTNSTMCEFEKERYSDGLVGNVYFYRVCDNLTVGQTYTIELGVTVAAGENITIYDESWSTYEVTPFAVSVANIAPFVAITYPTANLRVNETVEINWTASDFNGDRFVQNVTINNETNTTILEQNLNDTTFSITFNSANFSDGFYNVTVSVCENESADRLCSEDIVRINITQSIVVPVIGGEFTVNECPVDSTALSIVFLGLIILVLGIIIIALLLKSGLLVMGSSMGLFIMGWFIAGCVGAMSGVVTFIAISLFVLGITMKNI